MFIKVLFALTAIAELVFCIVAFAKGGDAGDEVKDALKHLLRFALLAFYFVDDMLYRKKIYDTQIPVIFAIAAFGCLTIF